MNIKLSKEDLDKRAEALVKLQASIKIVADLADEVKNMMPVDNEAGEIELDSEEDAEDAVVQAQIQRLAYAIAGLGDSLSWSVQYLQQDINSLYSALNAHQDGHLPKIQSAEQMARAVTKLGLDAEYEVQKKMIYASEGRKKTLTIG